MSSKLLSVFIILLVFEETVGLTMRVETENNHWAMRRALEKKNISRIMKDICTPRNCPNDPSQGPCPFVAKHDSKICKVFCILPDEEVFCLCANDTALDYFSDCFLTESVGKLYQGPKDIPKILLMLLMVPFLIWTFVFYLIYWSNYDGVAYGRRQMQREGPRVIDWPRNVIRNWPPTRRNIIDETMQAARAGITVTVDPAILAGSAPCPEWISPCEQATSSRALPRPNWDRAPNSRNLEIRGSDGSTAVADDHQSNSRHSISEAISVRHLKENSSAPHSVLNILDVTDDQTLQDDLLPYCLPLTTKPRPQPNRILVYARICKQGIFRPHSFLYDPSRRHSF